MPIGLGLIAQRIGLGAAMWLLLLGPVALLIGLPRSRQEETSALAFTSDKKSDKNAKTA